MTTHCIILAWRIPWTGEPSWATDGLQSMRLQRVRHNWVTTSHFHMWILLSHTATAKSLQSCLTLCDPIDGSPPGSPVPEILQPRTLEWVAISFSNAWKWKVKVKSLSRVWPSATPWTAAFQAPPSMGFSRHKRELNSSICSNADGVRRYHTQWNKTEKEKFYMISLICAI